MILSSNVTHFIGVVEDINDPLNINRVRVRVFGIHTEVKEESELNGIPTEKLFWMVVAMPTTLPSISGLGTMHGLLPGSHVIGFYIDGDMLQQGIVTHSFTSIAGAPLDPSKGFNDPNGIYPSTEYVNQSGVPEEARGETPDYRDVRNNETNGTQQPVNIDPNSQPSEGNQLTEIDIVDILRFEEGERLRPYKDSEGYWTIGIGHLLSLNKSTTFNQAYDIILQHVGRQVAPSTAITKEESEKLFKDDIAKTQYQMSKCSLLWQTYQASNNIRQMMLVNMLYQMGPAGVNKFNTALSALLSKDYDGCYNLLKSSKWATQTGARANRVATCIRNGTIDSYTPVIRKTRSSRAMTFASINDDKNSNKIEKKEFVPNGYTSPAIEETKKAIKTQQEALDKINDGFEHVTEEINNLVGKINNLAQIQINKATELVNSIKSSIEESAILKETNKIIKLTEDMITESITKLEDWVGDIINFGMDSILNIIDDFIPKEGAGILKDDLGGIKLFEVPVSNYAPEYGKNKVNVTPGGHVQEFDDTPGNERYNLTHPSGTYNEVNAGGDNVNKIVGSKFEIIQKDNNVHITGECNVIIDGNSKILVLQTAYINVQGDLYHTIRGDSHLIVGKNVTQEIVGNVDQKITGNVTQNIDGNILNHIKGDYTQTVEGNYTNHILGNRKDTIDGNWDKETKEKMTDTSNQAIFNSGRIDMKKK